MTSAAFLIWSRLLISKTADPPKLRAPSERSSSMATYIANFVL